MGERRELSRSYESELLDDLGLQGPVLERTLRELGWINRRLGLGDRIARAVVELGVAPDAEIVDLGCGGGDVLAAIRRRMPKARLRGIDGNAATVEVARRAVDANFEVADLLAPELQIPACDVLVSTHFLYHLPDRRFGPFVAMMRERARAGVVIGELQRSALAARLFGWFGPLAGLSPMTVGDGVLAVQRAFTAAELRDLLGSELELTRWGFSMVGVLRA